MPVDFARPSSICTLNVWSDESNAAILVVDGVFGVADGSRGSRGSAVAAPVAAPMAASMVAPVVALVVALVAAPPTFGGGERSSYLTPLRFPRL